MQFGFDERRLSYRLRYTCFTICTCLDSTDPEIIFPSLLVASGLSSFTSNEPRKKLYTVK